MYMCVWVCTCEYYILGQRKQPLQPELTQGCEPLMGSGCFGRAVCALSTLNCSAPVHLILKWWYKMHTIPNGHHNSKIQLPFSRLITCSPVISPTCHNLFQNLKFPELSLCDIIIAHFRYFYLCLNECLNSLVRNNGTI